jgi:hypothetical protein
MACNPEVLRQVPLLSLLDGRGGGYSGRTSRARHLRPAPAHFTRSETKATERTSRIWSEKIGRE